MPLTETDIRNNFRILSANMSDLQVQLLNMQDQDLISDIPIMDSSFDPFPFQLIKLSSTTIGVRGGRWRRRVKGTDVSVALTCDIVGPSDDPEDYNTVTISETGYIVVDLDNFAVPTTLIASNHPTGGNVFPTGDTQKTQCVLGKVTWDTDHISKLEQYWYEGDIDDFFLKPDSLSLSYLTSGLMEIDGWHLTASTVPNTSSLFHYKQGTSSLYSNVHDFTTHQLDLTTGEQDQFNAIYMRIAKLKGDDSSVTLSGYGVDEYHVGLRMWGGTLPVATPVAGDHMFFKQSSVTGLLQYIEWSDFVTALAGGGGLILDNYVKMNGDAGYNKFTDGSMLANRAGNNSISPDLRRLYDSGGSAVVDWDTTNVVKMPSNTPFDPSSNDTGALQLKGGINFQQLSGGWNGNYGCGLIYPLDSGVIGVFNDGLNYFRGKLGMNNCAGYFEETNGHVVKLADANWAIDATGLIKTSSGIYIGAVGPFVSVDLADCPLGTKVLALVP